MKKFIIIVTISLLCLPLFAQNLNSNQVQVNSRVFTVGTNTYDADYNIIFNQWYRGHKSAEEARQGEDLSWLNDFTRNYTLNFQEGNLSVGDNAIGSVKIISFLKNGSMRDRYGGIALLGILTQLIYDSATGRLMGAQTSIEAYNAYFNVRPNFFDMQEFTFPLSVSRVNEPISIIDTGRNLVSYKNVYEYSTASSTTNGVRVCIYSLSNTIINKLKEADDYAKAMRRAIPSLMGNVEIPVYTQTEIPKQPEQPEQKNVFSAASHQLTADLNVFTEQDGGSRIIASLKKGDPVQVLEYGPYADWNGITARWVKVKTADDKSGWLFSGYLEAIRR
jgi:hypothetical protein